MGLGDKAAAVLVAVMMLAASNGTGAAESNKVGSPDTNTDPENIADKAPPIHLEQTAVLLNEGKPVVEGNYRFALANCQKARTEAIRDGGTVSFKPLPEDVAKRLGRTFYHIWYDGRRMAVRTDSWDFAIPKDKLCAFQPVHEAESFIDQPGEALAVDLTKGTATRQSSDGVVRHSLQKPDATDDALKMKAMALLQKQGFGQVMQTKESEGRVAGQPCRRVESDLAGSACIWTGGEQWGFSPDSVQQPVALAVGVSRSIPEDSILLAADPADGTGVKLTTESMTVGGEVADDAFAVPPGLKIEDQDR